jgi:hypothetical protein
LEREWEQTTQNSLQLPPLFPEHLVLVEIKRGMRRVPAGDGDSGEEEEDEKIN